MLHPSYTDLMKVVNAGVEEGETPVVNSRYSIVMATSKRARQIIGGAEPLVDGRGRSRGIRKPCQRIPEMVSSFFIYSYGGKTRIGEKTNGENQS